MLKNSGPVGATATVFVTAILLSGAGADFSIGSAHAETSAKADNCLAAPKGASPAGQHWYYHVDRASKRKCWYLHATEPVEHRAAVKHQAAAAGAAADANAEPAPEPQNAPAGAAPAAAAAAPAVAAAAPPPPAPPSVFPAPPAPTPDSTAGDTPPAPHVKMLTVRTSTPFVGTAVISPQNTPEQVAAATSAPQPPPHDAVAPAMDGAKPPSDSGGVEPRGKADAAYNAPAQTAAAAAANARTKTAEMFILLAFVLGFAAALIAVVGKIAGIYRKPEIDVEPDDAWVDDRPEARHRTDEEAGHNEQDVPFLEPHEHYGLADLHAEEWLDRSTAQDDSAVQPARNEDATQPQSAGPSQTDIEMALRVLRQARQSRVA